jgi:succinylglutamate desuccinylase
MLEKEIRKVAIIGGTHGNELTGVYLIKKFEQLPRLIERPSFKSLTLLANKRAIAEGKRYIEKDLNRCFLKQELENENLIAHEDREAKIINQMLGPKGNPQVDMIIDLHSTTANMGITIIPSSNHPFNLCLAAYLTEIYPFVKIYSWSHSEEEDGFLRSICKIGCTVEVGAVPQGVLSATLFQQTEKMIQSILDYIEAHNNGQNIIRSSVTIYEAIQFIDYPRNNLGELQAMIHLQLQDKDYEALNPGDAMFLTFDGQTINYEGKSTVYPVFINEAAYYEKAIAMCLTQKINKLIT